MVEFFFQVEEIDVKRPTDEFMEKIEWQKTKKKK